MDNASALTRTTIHLALTEYVLALWLMMGLEAADWRAATPRGRSARWLWTWACITFLVHVACAFHFTHHWSHAHAFEQTRRESGYGEGLYVNYFFIVAWTSDVVWWWIAPNAYAHRSPWIDRLLHGFLLFIAFNATVVFEQGAVRIAGLVGSFMLLVRWWLNICRARIARSAAKQDSPVST
ncbi:hypothetical protein AYO47_04750 [Planctomyces sp. SCGC AG-212-M04]|nr:hypothetical protein AYO47_04750 [Planctomyces sp. SCGC AG-212-M04]